MDFTTAGITKLIADRVRNEINDASLAASPPRHSWRVKPSDLAGECVAQLWYAFRWAAYSTYDGRMSRLFKRGHKAEAGVTDFLRASGWEIREYDKRLCYHIESDSYYAVEWEGDYDFQLIDVSLDKFHIERALSRDKRILSQYRVKDFHGHLSGYCDGIGRHPVHTNNEWILIEYKTYNTKRFVTLVGKTVKISDPKYFGQLCLYMMYRNLPAALFVAVNKNDDDIYIEIIPREDGRAKDLLQVAHTVVTSRSRPARVSQQPETFFKCKTCAFQAVCAGIDKPLKSCRSCTSCLPMEGGNFFCDQWKKQIPGEIEMKAGCPAWNPIQ